MAIKFFKSIDLTHNELQNAKLHLTGTAPQADEGKIYFDTASDTVKVYVDYAAATDVWETVAFQSWATNQFLEDSEVTTFAKSFLDDGDAATVRTTIGVDAAGTDNSTDVTLANVANNYLSISGQEITAGTVPISLGGTGATTAAAARTALGVDAAGTDNSTNVSLAGSYDYITAGGTNNQTLTLGQITNADLEHSSITVNGSAISLGGSVTTLQLGTSSTTALAGNTAVDNVSNANLLTALANLESTNGSGVNENITIGASAGDTILITGNLTVQGTTTTLNTETVTIEDNIILLNSNVTGTGNGTDAGIEVERGDDTNVSLFWDESESAWTVTNTSGNYQILQSVGGTTFKVDLDAAESSVSKATNTYTVTHNLGTKDVIIQVVDISDASPTYETVFTENQRPTTNTVTIAFGNTVTDGHYRVLISQV
jgi:hypothetical protein